MRPIVLLLATAVALAACGGDDDGQLSADEYRKRANELCAKAYREVQQLPRPQSAQGLVDFLQKGAELSRKYDRRLEELEPPDRFRRLHDEGVRLSRRVERQFEDLVAAVRAADDPIAALQRELQRMLPEIQRGDEINQELGLDECLEAPGLRGTPGGPA